MPADERDYKKIETYKTEAAEKNYEAAGITGAAGTLSDEIMSAVRADRQTRGVSKLATDVGRGMSQLVTEPGDIRDRTRGIVDPFSVNELTRNARAQTLGTLGTVATQKTLNQGTLDEVIQAGANQLKARATMLQAEADRIFNKATTLESERDFEEGVRQFNVSQAYRERDTGGGAGTGPSSALTGFLESIFGTQEQPSGGGVEAQPLYTPFNEGTVSQGGQWVYQGGQWTQNTGTGFSIGDWDFIE